MDTVSASNRNALARLFVWTGLSIAALGSIFFLAQYFDNWTDAVRLLLSFGIGVPLVVRGVVLEKRGSDSTGYLLFGIPLLSWGLGIVAEMIWDHQGHIGEALVYSLCALLTLGLYNFAQRNVAVVYALLFATAVYFNIVQGFAAAHEDPLEIFGGATVLLGMIWGVHAYFFSGTKREPVVGFVYIVGSMLLFSGIALLSIAQSSDIWLTSPRTFPGIWEIVGVMSSAGVLYASIKLVRSSLMCSGGVGLSLFLLDITVRYFREHIGWSLSLIVCGLLISAIGGLLVWMRQKYL